MVPVELGRKVVSGTVRHVELSSCRAVGTVRVLSGSCQVLLSSCRTGAQVVLPCRRPLRSFGRCDARASERGAAPRSRRDGHLSVRALRAIASATRKNLVGLIFERDWLNLKEFSAELPDSRRNPADQFWQRDSWLRGSWLTALIWARKWAGRWPEVHRAAHCLMHRWGPSQCKRTGSRDRKALWRDAAHCPSLAHWHC